MNGYESVQAPNGHFFYTTGCTSNGHFFYTSGCRSGMDFLSTGLIIREIRYEEI